MTELNKQIYGHVGQPEKGKIPVEFGTMPDLDTKDTGGAVGQPSYDIGYPTKHISTMSADTTNSDTNLNQTASGENLSAKYKYPRVSEDVPAKGNHQYE